MITITHFFKTFFPDTSGGLEEAIRQIAKVSINEGYKVQVVTLSNNPRDEYIDGIRVISFKTNISFSTMPISFSLINNFKKVLDSTDIIHLHYPYPFMELLTLLSGTTKPIVLTFHGSIVGRKLLTTCYSPFLNALYRKVDYIVPTSEKLARTSHELDNFWDKIVPINLWIDESRFTKLKGPSDEFKTKIDRLGDFALYVGVLRHYKGIDTIIDASKSTNGNIVMIGKGPKLDEARQRINDEHITNLYPLGFQSDENLAYALKKCTMVILPSCSRGECFGQVLLEGSYFKKTLISTELGTGTSVANKDGISGFVIDPNSPEQLAEKMNLLFDDLQLRDRMSHQSFDYLMNNFTAKIQGRKYIELYHKLANKK